MNRKGLRRKVKNQDLTPIILLACFVVCGTGELEAAGGARVLADGGQTGYRIVVGAKASPGEKAAAGELAKYLGEITGAAFPIVSDSEAQRPREIIVGSNARLAALGLGIDWEALGGQGLLVKTAGESLVIVGGGRGGTINGVYEFLEEFCGCRWYALDCTVIPKREELALADIDHTYVPPFKYRRHGWYSDRFADWAAPNHINAFIDHAAGLPKKDARLADSWWYPENAAVHTLGEKLCDVRKHFAAHPEYFAEVDGKRVREHTQLCLSNADVLKVVAEDAKRLLAADRGAKRLGISAADWDNYCRCAPCKKLYDQYGVAGAYVKFANDCAAEIAKDFPDVVFDTLIYRWQRDMPPEIEFHPNFCVLYCPIEGCVYHALDECRYNVEKERFPRELAAWSKATKHLTLWLYTDSAEYLTPYPILRAMSRNFRYAHALGADGVFIEGHTRFAESQLGALTSWILARLLWKPDFDVEAGIEEFTNAYYPKAAAEVREFIAAINDATSYTGTNATRMLPLEGFHVAMQNPQFLDLREEVLRGLAEVMERAMEKAAGNWRRVVRVRVAFLALEVKILDQLPPTDPLWRRTRESLFEFLKWTDVNTIKVYNVDDYRRQVDKKVIAEKEEAASLPAGKEIVEVPEMWLFRLDPEKVGEKEKWFGPGARGDPWREISTHKFWDHALENAPFEGDGWYAIDLVIPAAEGKEVWLIFGAVDENYTLWINGKRIADNLDAGTSMWDKPAPVDITGQYKPGETNHVVVRVKNTKAAGGIWKPSSIVAEE